jgi:hypothetical protein
MTHWHGATVHPPNALGIVQPEVTPNTDWDKAHAKREMVRIIRGFQGRMRFQTPDGRVVEPADWWLEHEPLIQVSILEGAGTVAVFECDGNCQRTAAAFVEEFVGNMRAAGAQNVSMQHSETDTAELLTFIVPNAVPNKRYPRPLPEELARWYVYSPDCGHSIVVIPTSELPTGDPAPVDFMENCVPVPVRTVQRLGYTSVGGFLVCPVEYDSVLGALPGRDDEEW